MTRTISKGLVLVAGLLMLPGPADPDPRPADTSVQTDPRLIRIKQYFLERDCPAHLYAEDFLVASDRHDLDWRLLPSLSMVESTGGKEAINNNMFGWDNGRIRFRTRREGIYLVAARLSRSHYYRGKKLGDVLRTYNPIDGYGVKVKHVMDQLGPANLAPDGIF